VLAVQAKVVTTFRSIALRGTVRPASYPLSPSVPTKTSRAGLAVTLAAAPFARSRCASTRTISIGTLAANPTRRAAPTRRSSAIHAAQRRPSATNGCRASWSGELKLRALQRRVPVPVRTAIPFASVVLTEDGALPGEARVLAIAALTIAVAPLDAVRDVSGSIVFEARQHARALSFPAQLAQRTRLRAQALLAYSFRVEQHQAGAVSALDPAWNVAIAARSDRYVPRGSMIAEPGLRVTEAAVATVGVRVTTWPTREFATTVAIANSSVGAGFVFCTLLRVHGRKRAASEIDPTVTFGAATRRAQRAAQQAEPRHWLARECPIEGRLRESPADRRVGECAAVGVSRAGARAQPARGRTHSAFVVLRALQASQRATAVVVLLAASPEPFVPGLGAAR
jgi:hypothetical protein